MKRSHNNPNIQNGASKFVNCAPYGSMKARDVFIRQGSMKGKDAHVRVARLVKLTQRDAAKLVAKQDLSGGSHGSRKSNALTATSKASLARRTKLAGAIKKAVFMVTLDLEAGLRRSKPEPASGRPTKTLSSARNLSRPVSAGKAEIEKMAKLKGDEFAQGVMKKGKADLVTERLASFLELDE